MTYWITIYRANLKKSVAGMLQYRFTILIWAVWGFIGPLIALAVWSAASSARGGTISNGAASFTPADFAAYYLVFMIFGHIVMSWDAFEFAWRVRDGNLSPRLLKPLHPIHNDIADNLAFKLVTSTMLLPVWIVLFVLLRPAPPSDFGQLILAVPALALAFVIRYLLQYCLAVVAFWTTRVDAINQLYYTMDAFLGGRVAPLSLLPAWMGLVATFAPFRSMLAFPVELALGRVAPGQILVGFGLQVVWLCISVCLLKVMWRAGVRQYSAVGA